MRYFGQIAISEFLGDNVVYRNLVPMDKTLPTLEQLRGQFDLFPESVPISPTPDRSIPRKTTQAYAQVVAQILAAAAEKKQPGTKIEQVIFIGDTRLNDVHAFTNICQAGKWPGLAFIGDENELEPAVSIEEIKFGAVMQANRWSALSQFRDFCEERGFIVDSKTAVLLDLDKTTLGGRGRNDEVINQARLEAATLTVASALGEKFDPVDFQKSYDYFNETRFHPFTTDNQDYLVYICLMVSYGLFTRYGVKCALENEVIRDFKSFLDWVDRRAIELPEGLRSVHEDVIERFRAGDPTPFKAFRQAEYLATVKRMGQLGGNTSVNEMLSQEIVITQEVRDLAMAWREMGALIFGLSDKPDEASIPSAELAAQGYKPIHRVATGVVGGS